MTRRIARRKGGIERRRLFLVMAFFFVCFAGLFVRLLTLQLVMGDSLRERAERQGRFNAELLPWRGTIYDSRMRELAISVSTDSLYLRPGQVEEPEKILPEVASVLDMGKEELEDKLSSSQPFVWIRRKVERHRTEALNMFPGMGKVEESSRVYPAEALASHVIGFAGMDNYGLEGIEFLYDRYLRGNPGSLNSRKDGRMRETVALRERRVAPHEGDSLILTLDKLIQFIVEDELDRFFTAVEDDSSRVRVNGASVVVMQPATGKILALANRPSFSPLEAGSTPADRRRNRALTDVFEPGSSFKIVCAAAALEEGVFRPEDEIFCHEGAYRIAGHTIRDVSPAGRLTFSEVIQKSSNIGMVKVGREVGDARLYDYVRGFGFGERTGCDLPGEARGLLRHPRHWSSLSNASISFGYEVGVSAIQMASAYSAIANGGVLMRPMVVEAIVDKDGRPVSEFEPEERRRVVSDDTARALTEMLVGAVEDGTGSRARIPGYAVAGKTGTARKIGEDGAYSRTEYVASFGGFAPADDPEIAVFVMVDAPEVPSYQAYGGSIAAPVFQRIVSRVLRYLGGSPSGAGGEIVEAPEEDAAGAVRARGPAFKPGEGPPGASESFLNASYIIAGQGAEGSDVEMPDVTGLSMREVIRILSPYSLDIEFRGSGTAARQFPEAGEKLEPGMKCRVIFSDR